MPGSKSKQSGKAGAGRQARAAGEKRTAGAKKKAVAKAPPAAHEDLEQAVDTSNYAVGDRITHPQFGDGAVTAIDGDKLTIKFADGRMRQIVDYYVKHRAN